MKNKMYDAEFDAQIRALRPDWFTSKKMYDAKFNAQIRAIRPDWF